MSQAKWVENALLPYAIAMQTTPILALVPVIGVVLGYNFPSRVLVVVLISVFPFINNALFGLLSADKSQHDLLTLHDVSRWTRLTKLQLPAALPAIFTGLRVAAVMAVVGAVVGDFFFTQGSPGLGQLIKPGCLAAPVRAHVHLGDPRDAPRHRGLPRRRVRREARDRQVARHDPRRRLIQHAAGHRTATAA